MSGKWLVVAIFLGSIACTTAADNESGPNFAIPEDWTPDEVATYREAVALFEEAREADSDSAARMEAAISALLKAMRQHKCHAPTRYYLGIAYQITCEFKKARLHLERALEFHRDFHEAMVELGDTYLHLREPDKAIRWYDRAVETAPDYVHAYRMRSYCELREGCYEACVADADRVLAVEEDDPFASSIRQKAIREIEGEGWDTTYVAETDHFTVRTDTDQGFAGLIAARSEAMFELYCTLFPKIRNGKRRATIVIHADREAYHRSGAPRGAGGHYDPMIRKLVLFRYEKLEDTMLVLQHEGFHQFLHQILEDAPIWFNEGLAEFFGAALCLEDGTAEIRVNPWRIKAIKKAIRQKRLRSFREIMLMNQAEFYHREWASVHYAQAWSMIYFFGTYGERRYFPLLQRYFEVLRDGDGQQEGWEATFGRLDPEMLETIVEEWKRSTLDLKE